MEDRLRRTALGLAVALGPLVGSTATTRETLATPPGAERRSAKEDFLAGAKGTADPASVADEDSEGDASIDPLGPNAACYVCHMTFVREAISKAHLAERIGCVRCHGLSADHANDEDIGATPPDIVWARNEVDRACGRCHSTHDAPAQSVVARFLDRKLPVDKPPVCTDCHGRHRIETTGREP